MALAPSMTGLESETSQLIEKNTVKVIVDRCTFAKARKMKALLDGDFLQKCGTQSCRGFHACFRCFDGAPLFTSSEWCISLLMPLGTLL